MSKIHHIAPDAAPPPKTAKYSHAVEADGWLYVTGQLPADPDAPDAPFPEGIEAQTEMSLRNLTAILKHAGYTWRDIVFVRIFLSNFERDYAAMNSVFHKYLDDDATMPSRTTVGVAVLGRGALVEIDLARIIHEAPSSGSI